MKIETTHKVSLTQEELDCIIREHYGFLRDTKIELFIESPVTDTPTDDWASVPTDWQYLECPILNFDNKIQVMFMDGETDVGEPHEWDMSWDQSVSNPIVKYRELKG
jgi:hypothetical protein